MVKNCLTCFRVNSLVCCKVGVHFNLGGGKMLHCYSRRMHECTLGDSVLRPSENLRMSN